MFDLLNKHWKKWTNAMDPYVFIPAAVIVVIFVFMGGLFPKTLESYFSNTQEFIITYFSGFYVSVTICLLLLCVVVVFSKWGDTKIGPDDSVPEYSRLSWLSMLFSAGMGTGLIFWSVAEPLTHFTSPPPQSEALTIEAFNTSMIYTFFHWGLHPWAIYSIFALAISYYHFRLKQPLAPRSLLYPLVKDHVNTFWGRSFDVICTVGTLFGVSTSLGLGAMQINSGLREYTDLESSTFIQVCIIALITAVATVSVVMGIKKGIRRLSHANIILATVLTALIFILGPTKDIVFTFFTSLYEYIKHLPALSTTLSFTGDERWQSEWTFFYWGWWISWSPFVGIFIARISKGRTIRELILSVLFIPSLATFVWLSIYGGTALKYIDRIPINDMIETPSTALHLLLNYLPFGGVLSPLFTLLIVTFFISSSDSGSLVDDMVTSGGHPNPPKIQRLFWAIVEGLVAMTLLLTGGLKALQSASLTVGLPMAVVLMITSYGLCVEIYKARKKKINT